MNRLAAALATTFLIFGASEGQAAIFRIQGATTGSKAVIVAGSDTFQISGEFKFLTDYRDSSGAVVTAGSSVTDASLQAWNISVYNNTGTLLNNFVKGYSDPAVGGITDNSVVSSGSVDANSFTLEKSGTLLRIDTLGNFNTAIGDSVGGSVNSTTLTTQTSYNGIATTSVTAGQVDFVPFGPALVALFPVFALTAKLRKSFS